MSRSKPLCCAITSIALAIGTVSLIPTVSAKEPRKKVAAASEQGGNQMSAMVVRIWKDGRECPTGRARLRPYCDGQLDTSRYVEVGRFSNAEGLEYVPQMLGNMVTLNISKLMDDMKTKPLKESLISIAPGRYVLTWITCRHGNSAEWIGVDKPIFLFKESGRMAPVKGANVIDVRPGEIVDAGVLEIRSDDVGFFEAQTARVIAQPAPPHERNALREVAGKFRSATFTEGNF